MPKLNTYWAVTFKCYEGGNGWGEEGNKTTILFPYLNIDKYLTFMPGGWGIIKIELTNEPIL